MDIIDFFRRCRRINSNYITLKKKDPDITGSIVSIIGMVLIVIGINNFSHTFHTTNTQNPY